MRSVDRLEGRIITDLGFTKDQMDQTLRYIRDECPIIIHFNAQRGFYFGSWMDGLKEKQ